MSDAAFGDLGSVLRTLASPEVNANAVSKVGDVAWSGLMCAAANGDLPMVEAFLSRPDINVNRCGE